MKRELDARTLRGVVSRLRRQAAKHGNERAEAKRHDDAYEVEFWNGGIAALHGMGDALLDEARRIEKRARGGKR